MEMIERKNEEKTRRILVGTERKGKKMEIWLFYVGEKEEWKENRIIVDEIKRRKMEESGVVVADVEKQKNKENGNIHV